MIVVKHPKELMAYTGKRMGTSDWMTIDQGMIDRFAELTGDDNWIHVDKARAAAAMPGGKTIAHGFLTLAMTPILGRQIFRLETQGKVFNYGADNLRFPGMVPCGERIRLTMDLMDGAERPDGGFKFTVKSTVEAEGQPKPVCVFDKLMLIYPDES